MMSMNTMIKSRMSNSYGMNGSSRKIGSNKSSDRRGGNNGGEKPEGSYLPFEKLPFDVKEMILRFLPAREIGRCCAVSKSWSMLYHGTVASIYASVVGVARGRTTLTRSAELKLIYRLRNTHEAAEATETALWAAFNGYNEFVLRLIRDTNAKVTIESVGSEEWDSATLLHVACRQGNHGLVKALVKLGANVAALTKQKQTPLMLACEYGQTEVVDLLLETCGRDLVVNQVDKTGRSALYAACEKGHTNIVSLMLDWGEMIQQETGEAEPILDIELGTLEMSSPLCVACRYGYASIVDRLLDSHVNVNKVTEDGRSPIYLAAEWGKMTCCKILIKKRPPVNEKKMIELLFDAQPQAGREAAIALAQTETLIPNMMPHMAGVLIDLTSQAGKTPLFCAAERGNLDLTQLLIEASADPNKPTSLNKTPLYAATENGHTAVVKELLQYSSRSHVMHETNYGTSAIFIAERNGNMAIKKMLNDFCMEKMTKENTRKRAQADPKKQNQAMDRLLKRKGGSKGAGPSSGDTAENTKSSGGAESSDPSLLETIRKAEKKIAKSKAEVSSVLDSLNALEDSAAERIVKIKNGEFTKLDQESSSKSEEENVEAEPEQMPSSPTNADGDADDFTNTTSSGLAEISTQESDQVDVPEMGSLRSPISEQDTSRSEETRNAPVKQASVREARAAYFEKLASSKDVTSEEATPAKTGANPFRKVPLDNEGVEPSPRLVSKKEKDLMAAKKFSEAHYPEEKEDVPEEFATQLVSLKDIRTALIRFATLTTEHNMDESIFEEAFAEIRDDIRPIFKLFQGTKKHANAWDVFVACTLTAKAKSKEKLKFCFGLFDTASKGVIEPEVASTMLKCCFRAIAKVKGKNNLSFTKEELKNMANDMSSFASADEKSGITADKFSGWVLESEIGVLHFKSVL